MSGAFLPRKIDNLNLRNGGSQAAGKHCSRCAQVVRNTQHLHGDVATQSSVQVINQLSSRRNSRRLGLLNGATWSGYSLKLEAHGEERK